jgi:transcriptional regulator with XRE-family HTH domain
MASDSTNNTLGHGLWYHIGARLRSRRAELGLADDIVAAHLGIPVRNYQQFEAGRARIPAALLLQASELFKIPLSYFFLNLPFGDDNVEHSSEESAPVYRVSTTEDQLTALARNFLRSSELGRSHLLLLARAFAQEAYDTTRWQGSKVVDRGKED